MDSDMLSALQHMLEMTMYLGGIILMPMLVIGLIISIFQTATSIQEQSLSLIPKLIIGAALVIYAGDLMLTTLVDYTIELFESIPELLE